MNQEKTKIRSFTDLKVWKEGHDLVISLYKITDTFPQKEIFGLTNQMRRSAVSITSNIAEGFSRQTYKEKIQFYCGSRISDGAAKLTPHRQGCRVSGKERFYTHCQSSSFGA